MADRLIDAFVKEISSLSRNCLKKVLGTVLGISPPQILAGIPSETQAFPDGISAVIAPRSPPGIAGNLVAIV